MRFSLHETKLTGLTVLERKVVGDARGYLERMFCETELEPVFGNRSIVQVNHTLTQKAGAVRGLHFQRPPFAEMKLVSCLRGSVFDVAVDLRQDSATFGQWHGEVLSEDNHRTLAIPEGFAHGFQPLSEGCELLYFHTAAYSPAHEDGLNAQDSTLAIAWPLPVSQQSDRDMALPVLQADFLKITL